MRLIALIEVWESQFCRPNNEPSVAQEREEGEEERGEAVSGEDVNYRRGSGKWKCISWQFSGFSEASMSVFL